MSGISTLLKPAGASAYPPGVYTMGAPAPGGATTAGDLVAWEQQASGLPVTAPQSGPMTTGGPVSTMTPLKPLPMGSGPAMPSPSNGLPWWAWALIAGGGVLLLMAMKKRSR